MVGLGAGVGSGFCSTFTSVAGSGFTSGFGASFASVSFASSLMAFACKSARSRGIASSKSASASSPLRCTCSASRVTEDTPSWWVSNRSPSSRHSMSGVGADADAEALSGVMTEVDSVRWCVRGLVRIRRGELQAVAWYGGLVR